MIKIYSLLILGCFSAPAPTCPEPWTQNWASGMAQVFEQFLFKEIVTDTNVWNYDKSCFPKIKKVDCVPPLDEIDGEYPFQVNETRD